MMTEPSSPALSAIWRAGHERALRTISTPVFWSSLCVRNFRSTSLARNSATPPPGRRPRAPPRVVGEPLLQLFAVVVRGGLLDLRLDLLDTRLDVGFLAGAA